MKKLIVSLLLLPFFISAEEPQPLYEGSSITFTVQGANDESYMLLSNGETLDYPIWEILKKETSKITDPKKKDIVIDALTRYNLQYDKVDKIIRFRRANFLNKITYEDYPTRIQIIGYLEKGKIFSLVEFVYHAEDWIFAKKIKIVADDYTWEASNRFSTEVGNSGIWEYCSFEYNPKMKELIKNIINSKETIVRFSGKYYDDFTVTQRMKDTLKLMSEAIVILNGK